MIMILSEEELKIVIKWAHIHETEFGLDEDEEEFVEKLKVYLRKKEEEKTHTYNFPSWMSPSWMSVGC